MKIKFSQQKYANISRFLSAIALGIFAVVAIFHACRAHAHVDYIGPEGINNATRDQQEAHERDSNQGKTTEQHGEYLRDAVDNAIREYERESNSSNDNSNDRGGDNYSSGNDYGNRGPGDW